MELTAVIEALNALRGASEVELLTDSEYVRTGITEWIHSWKKRGWTTADKRPVKNSDLWRALDDAARRHRIQWRWVRGHDGNPGNERADALADPGAAEHAYSSMRRSATAITEGDRADVGTMPTRLAERGRRDMVAALGAGGWSAAGAACRPACGSAGGVRRIIRLVG